MIIAFSFYFTKCLAACAIENIIRQEVVRVKLKFASIDQKLVKIIRKIFINI